MTNITDADRQAANEFCARPRHEQIYLAEAFAAHRELSNCEAVAEVVAWLRAQNPAYAVEWALCCALADAIERGDYRKDNA